MVFSLYFINVLIFSNPKSSNIIIIMPCMNSRAEVPKSELVVPAGW